MTGFEIAAIVMAIVSVLVSVYSIYLANKIKPPGVNTSDFDENSIPTPKEGGTIPIVFGTRRIKDASIVFYGDIGTKAVIKKI